MEDDGSLLTPLGRWRERRFVEAEAGWDFVERVQQFEEFHVYETREEGSLTRMVGIISPEKGQEEVSCLVGIFFLFFIFTCGFFIFFHFFFLSL